MDSEKYARYTTVKEEDFEIACKRCGKCCGSLDDPCWNLSKTPDGEFFCEDYANRFGPQKTVSGKDFECVPIRVHIEKGSLRSDCAYLKI
ncbi:hypothetical protein ACFL5E_00880 [Candidatus Omnitrophota bacterium]